MTCGNFRERLLDTDSPNFSSSPRYFSKAGLHPFTNSINQIILQHGCWGSGEGGEGTNSHILSGVEAFISKLWQKCRNLMHLSHFQVLIDGRDSPYITHRYIQCKTFITDNEILRDDDETLTFPLLHTSTNLTFPGPRLNPSPFLETTVKIPSISVTDPFLDKILLIGICMQSPVWTMWHTRTFCPTKPARPTLFRCGYFCSCFVKFLLQGWILVLFIFLFCSNRHFILLKSDAVFCSFGAQTNRL